MVSLQGKQRRPITIEHGSTFANSTPHNCQNNNRWVKWLLPKEPYHFLLRFWNTSPRGTEPVGLRTPLSRRLVSHSGQGHQGFYFTLGWGPSHPLAAPRNVSHNHFLRMYFLSG